jgi:hypothetical protein
VFTASPPSLSAYSTSRSSASSQLAW